MFSRHCIGNVSRSICRYTVQPQRTLSIQSPREIRKIGVVGLGLMGHGIAQVCAQAGYQVIALEHDDKYLEMGMSRINDSLNKVIKRDIKKEKITEEQGQKQFNDIISRISTSTNVDDAVDCDLIIEAIAENMDLKLGFYKDLSNRINPKAIFASNTSSLQITAMGHASERPGNFVGLHFFNPVQMMKLVEVIRTTDTKDDVYEAMLNFCKRIGKVSVRCGDTPGFIVNRLLVPYMAQAMAMYERGHASIADIDVSMQLGAGHPMGPLHLADYVGLDTCLSIVEGWKEDYPEEPAFIVPQILKDMVGRGDIGRKSGKGFYVWDGDKVGAPSA